MSWMICAHLMLCIHYPVNLHHKIVDKVDIFSNKIPKSKLKLVKVTNMLNETDKKLIALLRVNARTPLSTLAVKLGVSRTTVQNRLARLEATGVIAGYTVTLKPSAEQSMVHALMFITVEGRFEAKIIEVLRGYTSVVEIHGTNGHWDLVLDVRSDSLSALHDLLLEVRTLEGVLTTETTLLLSSFKM